MLTSVTSWWRGRGARRGWRFGRGLCWRVPSLACPYERVAGDYGCVADDGGKSGGNGSPEDRLDGLADRPTPGPTQGRAVLSEGEREQLTRWSRRAKSAQALALRSRIVLACADPGRRTRRWQPVAGHGHTVARWRRRFVDNRLDGLADEPRPGRPPSILLDQVEEVIAATLEQTPRMPRTGRGRRWPSSGPVQVDDRADLAPVRPQAALVDRFKLSTDPQFVEKVVDVVGLYHHPPEKAVVLCVDEKIAVCRPWTAPNPCCR